jgi:hypothetical protein
MLIIKNGYIGLTRGDTARINVDIKSGANTKYVCVTGDTLKFSVKGSVTDSTYVFQKVITDFSDGVQIVIEPADTNSLSVGVYKYDIQLTLANGDVHTIVPPNKFEVLSEVTTS